MLTAEEFASLTQQNSGKCVIETVAISTPKLGQSINGRVPSPPIQYSKPAANSTCTSPTSGMYDGDVRHICQPYTFYFVGSTLIHAVLSIGEGFKTPTANDKKP